MLLPILIIRTDVKKNLDTSKHPAINPKLSRWMWRLRRFPLPLLCLVSLVAATTAAIYDLLQWLQPSIKENLKSKYSYAFAEPRQKPQQVGQNMTQEVDRRLLLQQLKSDYRQILIDYFTTEKGLKEKIDKFINAVFCANIPVPQIIEIHMELIEEFSKNLKLEGRSDEALLDYRLTLIDILAHLCEVYRCAIFK
ncbi:KaiA domain protein [Nostoc sp. PCC 7524]|uniref:KaiA domain-containing protein n=1 Tax=Nostoc sp. (strain ATCC 29411 / PCC 7524) TaxID=28072 RepID=UPI00029EC3DE|nr:KaiA domain-containing protein [Nostoc sp. PCC 7524]AFY49579.1 KaiA domain protein [Nostoc sp. PCC 7524]